MDESALPENNLLILAKSLVESGDLLGAESALAARVKIHPIAFDALILLAEIRLRLNKPMQVLELLQPFAAHRACADWLREYYIGERMNAEALAWLNSLPKSGSVDDIIDQAALLQISGDARSAAALCRKILNLQPDNAFAFNHLGRALFNAGMVSDAQQAFEKAVQVAPSYAQAWHNLGHVQRAQKNLKAALQSYEKALMIAPYYQSALLNIALLKMAQGDNAAAAKTLGALLELNPQHAEALLNLGICQHIVRDYDAAKQSFKKAIDADPTQARAFRHMAGLLREMQDSQAAVDYYKEALLLSPKDADLRAELIATLELLSELDEAEKITAEGLALLPNDPAIQFESAKLRRRRKDDAGAWQLLNSIDPNRLPPRLLLSYHYERGTVADRLGQFDQAFTAYAKGNELSVTSIRARNTDQSALPAQITRVRNWLERSAPSIVSDLETDVGQDLCFLIGFPRSGTTLLDVMLDGHEQVLSLEEKPTVEYAAFALDKFPGHYPDAMATLTPEQLTGLRSIYRQQLDAYRKPEHTHVIDKMPIRTVHASFIHRLFPKAKFIFAERHPCDVVLSNFMQHYAINEAMIHFTRMDSSVKMYDDVMRLWQLTEQTLPEMQVHRIRYESLITDSDTVLREACAFLGLAWQESMSQHQQTLEQRRHIKTNSYHQVAEPIYQRSKFRWLNYQKNFEPYMAILQPHIERLKY